MKFNHTYRAELNSLELIRKDLNQYLSEICCLSHEKILDVDIVIGEVLQNILRYEYTNESKLGTLKIEVFNNKDKLGNAEDLVIYITDDAPQLTDLSFLDRQAIPSELGGMGISLISALTKEYKINPTPRGNEHLIIIK